MTSPLLFSVLLALPGAAVSLYALRHQRKGDDAREWPTAPGEIGTSRVDMVEAGDIPRFRPVVTYTYQIGKEWYIGDRIRYGSAIEFALPWTARRWLARRFPVGARVRVAYRPDDPAEAVLLLGVPVWTRVLVIVGLLLTAIGALLPYYP